jgi:signal peptidase II
MTPNRMMIGVGFAIICLDQLSKWTVLECLPRGAEWVVLEGFFRLVHWTNTGAAWSSFSGYNNALAIVGIIALVLLHLNRHRFEAHTRLGQVSLGLVFGGIVGNLADRLIHKHVVDFLLFYVERRGGSEAIFPAFNIADAAICIGVGLVFVASLRNGHADSDSPAPPGCKTPGQDRLPSV